MRRRYAGRLGWLVVSLVLLGCEGRDQSTTPSAEAVKETAEAPKPVVTRSFATADLIDALFVGSGPLIPRDGITGCPMQAVWSGFPRGTAVRVRVSTTVEPATREAIQRAVLQVSLATNGIITATFQLTNDPNPLPGSNEVTATARPHPQDEGCGSDQGCIVYGFQARGILRSGRVLQPPGQSPNAYVRDAVGHGVLGMCLVDAKLIEGSANSLMSSGRGVLPAMAAPGLTALDMEAARALYASALNPGAIRRDLLRAGLVNLQAGQRRKGPSS
ncbi:MAG TPA: hypothetical protein VGW35_10860 [Methylomirabilota bacterium]|nr:hypothetical protein [Methylomirabilota bacterium]